MTLTTATTRTRVAGDEPAEEQRLSYMPALDGVRALAVLAVMAYHGGVSWLPGGFLGVDAFFVLSGFLITSLLLREWQRSGTIRLRAFWSRRARRLLPALFAMLVFVACFAAFVVPPGTYPGLRGDAVATLLYVANWHFILSGSNYFNQAALASPLTHTWSLAIEEQFYVLWPLVVLLTLTCTKRVRSLLTISVVGAFGSALEMALLYRGGASATRLYYGTDTHAQSLLVGTALAVGMVVAADRRAARTDRGRAGTGSERPRRAHVLTALGVLGAAGCAFSWSHLSGTSGALYEGGFLAAALCTAAVLVAAVRDPLGPIARVLSIRPLRYLGRISYGLYLWHYPIFLWLDGARTGLRGYPLFGLRCAVTLVVASASFFLLEQPVRRGRLLRNWRGFVVAPVAAGCTAIAVVAATSVPTVAAVGLSPSSRPAAPGQPVRVLTIGDSTALTMGMALSLDGRSYGVTQKVEAVLGCGITDGTDVKVSGRVEAVARPCHSGTAPPGTPALHTSTTPFGTTTTTPDGEKWTAWYRHWVDDFDPDVVVLLAGRWEVVTRIYGGRWTNITHPSFAAYVKRQLEMTVRIASARGAHVVLMTAPCYDQGEQPDGIPWPTDARRRLDDYNRLVREVAVDDAPVTSLFDLDALVCPGGVYHQYLGGVQIRLADGVHFTPEGATYLDPRIWPAIVDAARPQRAGHSVR